MRALYPLLLVAVLTSGCRTVYAPAADDDFSEAVGARMAGARAVAFRNVAQPGSEGFMGRSGRASNLSRTVVFSDLHGWTAVAVELAEAASASGGGSTDLQVGLRIVEASIEQGARLGGLVVSSAGCVVVLEASPAGASPRRYAAEASAFFGGWKRACAEATRLAVERALLDPAVVPAD